MSTVNRKKKWTVCILILLLCLSTSGWVYARTVVSQTSACTFTVEVNIAIWGPNATQAVADRWQRSISERWNGPSAQLIDHVGAQNGLSPGLRNRTRPNMDYYRSRGRAEAFLKDIGADCAEANCCKICFKITVKRLSDIPADERASYHQIKVWPRFKTITKADGTTESVRHRDFVRVPGGDLTALHRQSTTGEWSDVTGEWAAEAHETGHLMGLDDQYYESEGRCHANPGHEKDTMSWPWGPPWERDILRILEISNLKCENCCRGTLEDAWVRFGRTWRPATDAVFSCNEDVLNQALQDVKDQIQNLGYSSVGLRQRYDLYKRLKDLQKRIEEALEDCRKRERPPTGSGSTDGIVTGGNVSVDSSTFCEFWGDDTLLPPPPTPPEMPPLLPPELFPPSVPPKIPILPPTTPLFPELKPPIVTLPPLFPPPELIPPRPPGFPPSPPVPPPTTPPPEKPKPPSTPPPAITYKVARAVLNATGQAVLSAMPGARVKVNLFAPPALPIAGTARPRANQADSEDHGDPITGHTNEKGELTLGKDNRTGERQPSLSMLATGIVASDSQPLAAAEAMMLAKAQESPEIVQIVIPSFKSYIVKLNIDRSLKQWKDPAAYLKDPDLKPYIMRHWIVQDSMYVVFNFPVVEDQ